MVIVQTLQPYPCSSKHPFFHMPMFQPPRAMLPVPSARDTGSRAPSNTMWLELSWRFLLSQTSRTQLMEWHKLSSCSHSGLDLWLGSSFDQKLGQLQHHVTTSQPTHFLLPQTWEICSCTRRLAANNPNDCKTSVSGLFIDNALAQAPATPMLPHNCLIAIQPASTCSSDCSRHASRTSWASASNAQIYFCKSSFPSHKNQAGKSEGCGSMEK